MQIEEFSLGFLHNNLKMVMLMCSQSTFSEISSLFDAHTSIYQPCPSFLSQIAQQLPWICYYDTHIIDNSYVILYYFLYPTTLYPYNSLGVASMFLLSLSAICSLYHRYLSGHLPNIYRTNTEHIPDKYWTRIEGTPLLHAYYIEAAYKIDISSSIVLHKTEHTSSKE